MFIEGRYVTWAENNFDLVYVCRAPELSTEATEHVQNALDSSVRALHHGF